MSLSESKFNMWRTIVSLAHSDGIFHSKEQDYLLDVFDALSLSPEQKETLISDTKNPQDSKELFGLITEPQDRSQMFYFARIIFWVDEVFAASEEEAYNRLRELALDKVDFAKVMERVKQVEVEFKAKEETRKESRPMYQKIIDAIVFWEDLP